MANDRSGTSHVPLTIVAARGWTQHAEDRVLERYGITGTPAEWNETLRDILNAVAGIAPIRALMLRREGTRELWAVKLGITAMVVIYKPLTATIITAVEFDRRLDERYSQRKHQRRHMPRRHETADRYHPHWEYEE